jgi:hypothetical protein
MSHDLKLEVELTKQYCMASNNQPGKNIITDDLNYKII